MTDIIVVSEIAKKKLTELLTARQGVEVQLQTYLTGLQDGLGLEGNWNLDIQTWQFTKKEVSVAEVVK